MTGVSVTALLLIDIQTDFIQRPGLEPSDGVLSLGVATLLAAARRLGLAVAHIHTLVDPNGTNRMPHWVAGEVMQCVAGTAGALPPDPLLPADGELVVHKQFYSGFTRSELDAWLQARGVQRL